MKWMRLWSWARSRAVPPEQSQPDATAPAESNPEPRSLESVVQQARDAAHRQDWPTAETLWRSAIVLDDTLAAARTGLATALRRQDRLTEAEAVLRIAMAQCPAELDHALDYANLAQIRRDWPEAEQRWQQVRSRFADVWYSYAGCANALRKQGRHAEAVTLLTEAAPRFHWEPAFPQDLARLAADRKDWTAAEQHWRNALVFPSRPWWVHAELAAAIEQQGRLADAETVLLAAQAIDPAQIALFVRPAHLAEKRQDRPEAERRWRIVRERFPDRLEAYTNHADALRHLRQFDAADAVLRQAAGRFPNDTGIRQALARHAEARSDWATAAQHCRAVLANDENAGWARSALATALSRQGRAGEADTLLLDRQRSHPTDIGSFTAYAQLPQERGDWETAATRWWIVLRDFPDRPEAYEGVLRAARQAGRTDESGAILAEALKRFPTSEAILLEAAHLARHLGRIEDALQVLTLVRGHFPHLVATYTDAADILRTEKRLDEAQTLLAEAMARFPDHHGIWSAAGQVIEASDDWTRAVAHWAEMGHRFPYSDDQSVRMHNALLRLAEVDPVSAGVAAREQGATSPESEPRADI